MLILVLIMIIMIIDSSNVHQILPQADAGGAPLHPPTLRARALGDAPGAKLRSYCVSMHYTYRYMYIYIYIHTHVYTLYTYMYIYIYIEREREIERERDR